MYSGARYFKNPTTSGVLREAEIIVVSEKEKKWAMARKTMNINEESNMRRNMIVIYIQSDYYAMQVTF